MKFLLISMFVFVSGVSVAKDTNLKSFAEEVQSAFESGNQLTTNLSTQELDGECVHVHTPQNSGQSYYTYLSDSQLAINRWTRLGKRYLSFGYGTAGRTPAYIGDSGDLTLDIESSWYSTEVSRGSYKDIGTEWLRLGTIFGRSAYLYLRETKTFFNDIELPPVSRQEIHCYFEVL